MRAGVSGSSGPRVSDTRPDRPSNGPVVHPGHTRRCAHVACRHPSRDPAPDVCRALVPEQDRPAPRRAAGERPQGGPAPERGAHARRPPAADHPPHPVSRPPPGAARPGSHALGRERFASAAGRRLPGRHQRAPGAGAAAPPGADPRSVRAAHVRGRRGGPGRLGRVRRRVRDRAPRARLRAGARVLAAAHRGVHVQPDPGSLPALPRASLRLCRRGGPRVLVR